MDTWAKPHEVSEVTCSYIIERKEATGYVHLKDQTHFLKIQFIRYIVKTDSPNHGMLAITLRNRKIIEIIYNATSEPHIMGLQSTFSTGIELERVDMHTKTLSRIN